MKKETTKFTDKYGNFRKKRNFKFNSKNIDSHELNFVYSEPYALIKKPIFESELKLYDYYEESAWELTDIKGLYNLLLYWDGNLSKYFFKDGSSLEEYTKAKGLNRFSNSNVHKPMFIKSSKNVGDIIKLDSWRKVVNDNNYTWKYDYEEYPKIKGKYFLENSNKIRYRYNNMDFGITKGKRLIKQKRKTSNVLLLNYFKSMNN